MKLLRVCLLLVTVGAVRSEEEDVFVNEILKDALYFLNECGADDLAVCLKERALRYIDMLPQSFEIGGVIKVKQNEGERGRYNYIESLPSEYKGSQAKENVLDNILMKRMIDFFSSHTIELKVPKQALHEMKRSLDEGRKKKNKKGGGHGLFLLFCLKLAALGALALKVLAALSFKALIMAKIALTLSGIIALKKLVGQKHTSTYEVITHPHYEEHGRSDGSFGQDLAYRGQDAVKSTSEVH